MNLLWVMELILHSATATSPILGRFGSHNLK
jgi:hypothetical protein